MTKVEILDFLTSHKKEFHDKYGVEKIGLFGSFAKGNATAKSDIDIFVHMTPKFDDFMSLKFELEESLQTKVDLISKHKNMKPLLLQMIQKDIIYA